jgi:hypothetical protein
MSHPGKPFEFEWDWMHLIIESNVVAKSLIYKMLAQYLFRGGNSSKSALQQLLQR